MRKTIPDYDWFDWINGWLLMALPFIFLSVCYHQGYTQDALWGIGQKINN